ncbi:Retrovirus-related Pol polyprotein from transposon TNT 1-94 [Abeliophyllum distichum]|uniref:Retrovirus-related Pol polyprotein from transposon TNT 1-94 n=1 Tax=Abeliophyllum distichum TaxID=126358 RepID=A0ABD1Q3H3_9LAMI
MKGVLVQQKVSKAIDNSYEGSQDVIKYGRGTLTPDIVIDSLKSKERELKFEKNERKNGEVHFVRGRPQSEDGNGGRGGQNSGSNINGRSRSKSHERAKGKKCYRCGKIGHFISECYKEKNKFREEDQRETNVVTSSDESGELESTSFMGRLSNDMIRMCKGALRAFKDTRRNGIYITHAEVISGLHSTISSIDIDHTQKWHNRLAHVSVKGLKFLNDKGVFGKDQIKEKIDPKTRKCVFLGYPEEDKGYRLWDRSQKGVKIIISQDVKFNESEMSCLKSEKQQKTISGESLVEVEKVSTHISITLSEVESDTHQNQQNIDAEAYASYQELVDKEQNTYVKAIKSEKSIKWFSTMRAEMSSLIRNQTWDSVPKPKDKSIVECKWVYKVKKRIIESEPVRYKARLVAKGQWCIWIKVEVVGIFVISNKPRAMMINKTRYIFIRFEPRIE